MKINVAWKDGGLAFPSQRYEPYDSDMPEELITYPGLTVIDWFAGQAMIHAGGSEITMRHVVGHGAREEQAANLAEWCYDVGEAMVAEKMKRMKAWSEGK